MTYAPEEIKHLGKCPFGYQLRQQAHLREVTGDCGHRCCYPVACERLKRLGLDLPKEKT